MIVAAACLVSASLAMLLASAVLCIARLGRGSGALNRAIALDVLTAAVIATVVVLIAWFRRYDLAVLLIIFALTAFFSTVTVARYLGGRAK